MHRCVAQAAVDVDFSALWQRFNPVVDTILNQRLENQGRQFKLPWQIIHAPVHGKTFTQAQTFNPQILLGQIKLATQGRACAGVDERGTKQVGQVPLPPVLPTADVCG